MNKFLILAGVFMLCSLMNLLNVFLTGNGISLILGVAWLAASGYVFVAYRKMKANNQEEDKND